MTRTIARRTDWNDISKPRIGGRMLMTAFAAGIMLFAANSSVSAQNKQAPKKPAAKSGAWEIQIIPRTQIVNNTDALANVPAHVKGVSYSDVYRSIPFIRSEYDANPSYRHEAAMRILFGQLFPKCCCGANK